MDVELTVVRQMASYLHMPIFLMDADENLVSYNEAGEVLLGRPFGEVGEMKLDDLPDMFHLRTEDGSPLPLDAFGSVRSQGGRRISVL